MRSKLPKTDKLYRWRLDLREYEMLGKLIFEYCPGALNWVADLLSRLPVGVAPTDKEVENFICSILVELNLKDGIPSPDEKLTWKQSFAGSAGKLPCEQV